MKPYAFNLRKINEAKRGLTKAVNEQATKKDIRRWARLLESNSKLLVELLTEQILDEGKLPQGDLFAEGISGKPKKTILQLPTGLGKTGSIKTFIESGKECDKFYWEDGSEIKFKEDNSSTGLPNSGSTSDDAGNSEKRQGSDTY